MSKIRYLSHSNIVMTINNFHGKVFLFGYSQTTQESLAELEQKVLFIVDNNQKLHDTITSQGVCIYSVDAITQHEDALVIVWGNHCEANIKQLRELGVKNICVDLDLGGYRVHPPKFIIETPPASHLAKTTRTQHDFILQVMQELTLLEIPFETHPVADVRATKSYKKNSHLITLSYHTHGEEIPNLFRYKESYLPGYVTFDTQGFSGWHSLCQKDIKVELSQIDETKAKIFYKKIFKKYVKGNCSKYTQSETSFDFPKQFLFFPLQLSNDVVASLAFFTQEEVLSKLADSLKNTSVKLLVKRHPKCEDRDLEKLLKQMQINNEIILYEGSVHDAISRCKSVITANSGVGFEALLHLKPIYSFGKSEYIECTSTIHNLDELTILKPYKVNKTQIKKFLYYYLKRECLHKTTQIRKKIIDLLKEAK